MNEEQKNALIKAYENEFDKGSEELINEIKSINPITKSVFDELQYSKMNRLNSAMGEYQSKVSGENGLSMEIYFSLIRNAHSVKLSELNAKLDELSNSII